uniref:CUB domain-containing protein n=1 Tax=Ciona intestinalis TaxID=7719 RepID=H2XKJ1_CIOIN
MNKAVVCLLMSLYLLSYVDMTTGNSKYSGTFEKQIASSGGAKHFNVHYKKCYTSIPSSVQLTLTTYPIHLSFEGFGLVCA